LILRSRMHKPKKVKMNLWIFGYTFMGGSDCSVVSKTYCSKNVVACYIV
jgi:hypothetical protein